MMTWRDYEEEVATFFRNLGCTVEVHAQVQGVRTRHVIDVWALSEQVGLVTRWAIECKDWNQRIPKEKVLTLRAVVDDIGADRGFILNEAGFQSGAYEAARSSHVTVTSLAEMAERSAEALRESRLSALHRRVLDQKVRMHWLTESVPTEGKGRYSSRVRPGVDGSEYFRRLGIVALAQEAISYAMVGILPVPMPDVTRDVHVRTDDIEEVIALGEEVAAWTEPWLAAQEVAAAESSAQA